MYECKFVKVNLKNGAFIRKPAQDYKDIIDKHLKEGWKLVQIFSPNTFTGPSNTPQYLEIIFQRKTKK